MSSEHLKEFTDENFNEDALGANLPVVVDFWAPWCGPCKMLTPIFEELAEDFEGKVIFGKVNVDNSPQVASKYGVSSIPTMLFISGGEVKDQHVGLLAKDPLKTKIEAFIVQ